MIARVRGEHQDHWTRWRPSTGRTFGQTEQLDPPDEALVLGGREPAPLRSRSVWLHRLGAVVRWLTLLVVVSVVYVAISWGVHQLTPEPARLPATPRAWLDAYEAAALDNPSRVCSELFVPQLASAYAHGAPGGCRGYFGRVTSSSVTRPADPRAGEHRGARAAANARAPRLGGGPRPEKRRLARRRPARPLALSDALPSARRRARRHSGAEPVPKGEAPAC
jgi:hypothetical protein